jgi:hypothetical protein
MNKLEIQEKLDEMTEIYLKYGMDNEVLHIEFDKILLSCVPNEIRDFYNKIDDERGFWHA